MHEETSKNELGRNDWFHGMLRHHTRPRRSDSSPAAAMNDWGRMLAARHLARHAAALVVAAMPGHRPPQRSARATAKAC